MARFKGQPQMQRGMISSLNDRGKVSDQRQSRFSQNQFTPSVFIITDPTIINTSTVNDGTSWKFTRCFIYLCSNRSKRKRQNKQGCGEERVFNLGRLRSFSFLSPGMQEKRRKGFHFGTPMGCLRLKLAAPREEAASCLLLRRTATLQNCRLLFDVTQAVICGRHTGIPA